MLEAIPTLPLREYACLFYSDLQLRIPLELANAIGCTVSDCGQVCFLNLQLARRPILSDMNLVIKTHAFVTSKTSHRNAFYMGVHLEASCCAECSCQLTLKVFAPMLQKMHWLLLSFHVQFKLLSLIYKAVFIWTLSIYDTPSFWEVSQHLRSAG